MTIAEWFLIGGLAMLAIGAGVLLVGLCVALPFWLLAQIFKGR